MQLPFHFGNTQDPQILAKNPPHPHLQLQLQHQKIQLQPKDNLKDLDHQLKQRLLLLLGQKLLKKLLKNLAEMLLNGLEIENGLQQERSTILI